MFPPFGLFKNVIYLIKKMNDASLLPLSVKKKRKQVFFSFFLTFYEPDFSFSLFFFHSAKPRQSAC